MSEAKGSARITAKDLALLCNTDAKRMRSFIRSLAKADDPIVAACGQGNRYGFSPSEAKALQAAYAGSMRAHARQPQRTLADLEAILADDVEG